MRKERWDNVLVFRAGHLCGLKFLFALEQSDAEQAMLFDQRVSFPCKTYQRTCAFSTTKQSFAKLSGIHTSPEVSDSVVTLA
jgi:hypothetical protein